MKGKKKILIIQSKREDDCQRVVLAGGRQMVKPLRSWREFSYDNEKHHHRLVSSVMQVMKTRLENTRPATKAPLYYIEKVYTYSLIAELHPRAKRASVGGAP